ncbi:Hypp3651 [Branchiostoma lanceolatum]|uniref:Hypp3651 protein n=1 Tax=Branchiostoma lanceolatum TaxID=7740 RepID=A0A8K0EXN5_BRALA|nr:Hypp3651 [Branchiostoma lanceolatum]
MFEMICILCLYLSFPRPGANDRHGLILHNLFTTFHPSQSGNRFQHWRKTSAFERFLHFTRSGAVMTDVRRAATMHALLALLLVLGVCNRHAQGATTVSGSTTAGNMVTTQTMTATNQSDSTSSATTTATMGNTASNTSMDPTTQADGNTTVVTTRRMTTAGVSGSTVTTAVPNTTQPAASTMMNATSQATTMQGTTGAMNTTATMQSTTGAMNTTATMQSTTGAMNTTATVQGTTGAMNTTAIPGSTETMNTTATVQATSTMNTTAEMQGTTGGMNTTAVPGTTDTMNTTAEMQGSTTADAMQGATGEMNTTAMPSTTGTMDTTATQGTTGAVITTATMQGTTGEMNTTATMTGATGEMNTTATMTGATGAMNTTAGTPEATGTTASDNATMAPMNTTMMATTQTTTTTAPGPYTWNVTFDANCTVALNNEMEFLRNCSVAVADWLEVSENTTRCRNITCGSTNVIVEVDPPAYQQAVADKFENLNVENPADPLLFSFGGTNFTATSAQVIDGPPQPTTAQGTTLLGTPTTSTKRTVQGFCKISELDHTGCIILVCGVGACGLILFVTVVVCVVRCCRRQKSKSFDLLSDIPHISLSDYPMTTIPRPSVYQPGNNSGQVNMAYITDDDPDKPKQPLESSNTSQSSRSSGRTEDEKSTNAQTDNHVQQDVASASYQPVATEEQPPPVYSPQSAQ